LAAKRELADADIEQILDPVHGIAVRAVDALEDPLRPAGQVGDEEARVHAQLVALEADDLDLADDAGSRSRVPAVQGNVE
jgi:hypothetical protein